MTPEAVQPLVIIPSGIEKRAAETSPISAAQEELGECQFRTPPAARNNGETHRRDALHAVIEHLRAGSPILAPR
jgi:hypothetical protein